MDTVTLADATDLDAITELVATVQHAQQNELPEEFLGLFRHDAIWTTASGRRLFGRAAIAEFTRRVLPGAMAESTATYEVERVLFIRPDVAAVKVRQTAVSLDGVPLAGINPGTPTYVLAREDGRWLIVAAQNTEVVDG